MGLKYRSALWFLTSTKSVGPLVPDKCWNVVLDSNECNACPHSWCSVSTSLNDKVDITLFIILFLLGGVKLNDSATTGNWYWSTFILIFVLLFLL